MAHMDFAHLLSSQTSTPWNKKLCKIMHKLQNWWRTWSNSSQTSTPWNKKLCKIMKNCKIDGTHGLYTPASFNSKLCKNCKRDETYGLATRSFSVKDSNLDFKIMHQTETSLKWENQRNIWEQVNNCSHFVNSAQFGAISQFEWKYMKIPM